MNRKQKSVYAMGLALRDFLNQNATITASLPGFGNFFTYFSENLEKIRVLTEKQETDKSGIARQKRQLRMDLAAQALGISRKTATYARLTHNVVLLQEMHYTDSDLKRSSDTLFKDRVSVILEKAEANLQALSAYGVTKEAVEALKNGLEQFMVSMPQPRLGITERKKVTGQLNDLYLINEELLDNMDALVEVVRQSDPVFFRAYKNIRRVIETGSSKVSLKATITDAITHTGIKGVKVSLVQQNGQLKLTSSKPGKAMVKKTAAKGSFLVKSLPSGDYRAIIAKPGFREQEVTITVADNETAELYVELERNQMT